MYLSTEVFPPAPILVERGRTGNILPLHDAPSWWFMPVMGCDLPKGM